MNTGWFHVQKCNSKKSSHRLSPLAKCRQINFQYVKIRIFWWSPDFNVWSASMLWPQLDKTFALCNRATECVPNLVCKRRFLDKTSARVTTRVGEYVKVPGAQSFVLANSPPWTSCIAHFCPPLFPMLLFCPALTTKPSTSTYTR